jgi:hypothetical protein
MQLAQGKIHSDLRARLLIASIAIAVALLTTALSQSAEASKRRLTIQSNALLSSLGGFSLGGTIPPLLTWKSHLFRARSAPSRAHK